MFSKTRRKAKKQKVPEFSKGELLELPKNSSVKALIYQSNSLNPKEVSIKNKHEDFFYYKNKAYYITFDDVMYFKKPKLLWGYNLYLFYYHDNYKPLRVDEKLSSISQKNISNTVLHTALKSKAIEKANDIKSGLSLGDDFMYIGIGIAVLVFMFMMFGGG